MIHLLQKNPGPWRIEILEGIDTTEYDGGFAIYDASDNCVINGGTYTGDSDIEVNLDARQASELVDIVNTYYVYAICEPKIIVV